MEACAAGGWRLAGWTQAHTTHLEFAACSQPSHRLLFCGVGCSICGFLACSAFGRLHSSRPTRGFVSRAACFPWPP
eukprot:125443-Chlamydomonas_euryale.AAC.1